jgi:protein kinase C substrate 80K-H
LQKFNDAQTELSKLRTNKADADGTLAKLFDPEHFGAQGEWKKLENTCLEQESGESVH